MSNASRLSTANSYDNSIRNITTRQSALANLQENLTSGKRVVRASDDPTSAAHAERAQTRLARIATDQRALDSQHNAIQAAESVLGDVGDALQRFRELVVQAGSGTNTSADRRAITIELQGLHDQVFDLANRKDTNGLPLFSALGSALAPFVGPNSTGQDYTFNGLPGQAASSEVTIPFALDGESAFMHQPARDGVYNVSVSAIPVTRTLTTDGVVVTDSTLVDSAASYKVTVMDVTTAAGTTTVSYDLKTITPAGTSTTSYVAPGYPSNQQANIAIVGMPGLSLNLTGTPFAGTPPAFSDCDTITIDPQPSIFSVMDDAIRDIGGAANNNAASQAVGQALHNLDIGMERVSATRGQAGELLNRVDSITSNQEKRSIQLEADRSQAEDLDMIKGVSDFNNQQTGYQAALQSYAQVQKLSLFNYLG
jgi:flagellar hook-associated protein 3 FlgL